MPATDLEQLVTTYDRLGVRYDLKSAVPFVRSLRDNAPADVAATVLVVDSGIGYAGLHASFYFDVDGRMLAYGVWE